LVKNPEPAGLAGSGMVLLDAVIRPCASTVMFAAV
jgi:hypothetical protein